MFITINVQTTGASSSLQLSPPKCSSMSLFDDFFTHSQQRI